MPFRDVVGHRRPIGLLARSVKRASLPPSLIFAGPSGVGKRLAARAVAQALNCLSLVEVDDDRVDACGECIACTRIGRGVHADVLMVEPGDSGSIKIEQVRDVVDRAGYRPFEGRRRVVIIDEADALVVPAQHALLKTLEEPPPSSVFILVTSSPDMLLATVRSRCIRLWFAEGAKFEVDVEARDVAARVLTQVASAPDARGRIEGAQELLTKTGGGGAGDRDQLAAHLRAIASLLRDVEVVATHADIAGLATPALRGSIERLAGAYQGERGVRAFAAVDRALVALERNAGVKIVADWVVLQL